MFDYILSHKKILLFSSITILSGIALLWYINNYAERSSAADTDIQVSLISPTSSYQEGDAIAITLQTQNADYTVVATDIYLRFDPNILSYQGYEQVTPNFFDTELVHETKVIDSNKHVVHLTMVSTQSVPQSGIGLFRFNFVANAQSSTTIALLNNNAFNSSFYGLNNTNNQPAEFTIVPNAPTTTIDIVPPPTQTPTPTATPVPTNTPTLTNTPIPTRTPTPTLTNTPIPTATNTPTITPTNTSTPTPTATSTPIPTATPTIKPSATNTPIPPTNTPTLTYTPSPTINSCPNFTSGNADCSTDGVIDLIDFACWRYEFVNGSVANNCSSADFNVNGSTDLYDFAIWRSGFINTNTN